MTTAQLELPIAPLVHATPDATLTIQQRFDRFHADNPHILEALERLAEQWFAAGNSRVGVKALWERLRWEAGIQSSTSDYRLNNDWPAFYSRLLLARRPEWTGRIQIRKAIADEVA